MSDLTPEQSQVIQKLKEWHKSEETAINLSAIAGGGKTYTLAHYAKLFEGPITLIGPTHASLVQLRQRIVAKEGTRFLTVAKALGQFPVQSNSSTELTFGSFGGKPIEGLTIVDESSMLSEYEVKSLVSLCEKVIFSGDNNQLAPVKKKSGYKLLCELPQLTLTKMMRAESSAILDAGLQCLKIAQYIPNSSEDSTVICHENEEQFKIEFLNRVKTEKPGDCVYITYTNAEVQEINRLAHYAVSGRNALEAGDLIRLYASSKLGKNNCIAQVSAIELNSAGNYVISTEPNDGTNYKVEVALPSQYTKIEKHIESLVAQFKAGLGSEAMSDELKFLRAIVPIDFPYAVSTHKSQGSSIPIVFANSQRLHGRKSFYVAYSRAASQLNVCKKIGKTKGVCVQGTYWVNLKTGSTLVLEPSQHTDLKLVKEAIEQQFGSAQTPSISHLACVLNRSHASKSAKGWTLA